jgi:hypothetical protein
MGPIHHRLFTTSCADSDACSDACFRQPSSQQVEVAHAVARGLALVVECCGRQSRTHGKRNNTANRPFFNENEKDHPPANDSVCNCTDGCTGCSTWRSRQRVRARHMAPTSMLPHLIFMLHGSGLHRRSRSFQYLHALQLGCPPFCASYLANSKSIFRRMSGQLHRLLLCGCKCPCTHLASN